MISTNKSTKQIGVPGGNVFNYKDVQGDVGDVLKTVLVSGSKNLLPCEIENDVTIKGLTLHQNDDGSILINGTYDFSVNSTVIILGKTKLQEGAYIFSGAPEWEESHGVALYIWNLDQNKAFASVYNGSTRSITITEPMNIDLRIYFVSERGLEVNNYTVYPMLRFASMSDEYVKHVKGFKELNEFTKNIVVRDLHISRVGRFLDEFKRNDRPQSLFSQSITYKDGYYYLAGYDYKTDTINSDQYISVYSADSGFIRYCHYTELGHCQGITHDNDYFYTLNGGKQLSVLDNDLNYIETIEISSNNGIDVDSIYALSHDGDKIYCSTHKNSRQEHIIFEFDYSTKQFIKVCSFYPNYKSEIVLQSMTVCNGYAFLVVNRSNQIIKVEMKSGDIVMVYNIPDGDGYFPLTEPEDLLKVNGRIYLYSPYYYHDIQTTEGKTNSISFAQIFDTDLNGILISNVKESYARQSSPLTVYVNDSSTYEFNPINRFTTANEAAAILNYHKYGTITFEAHCSSISDYDKIYGYIYLMNGNYTINSVDSNAKVDMIKVWNSTIYIKSTVRVNTIYLQLCNFATLMIEPFKEVNIRNCGHVIFTRSRFTNLKTIKIVSTNKLEINDLIGLDHVYINPNIDSQNMTFIELSYKGPFDYNIFKLFRASDLNQYLNLVVSFVSNSINSERFSFGDRLIYNNLAVNLLPNNTGVIHYVINSSIASPNRDNSIYAIYYDPDNECIYYLQENDGSGINKDTFIAVNKTIDWKWAMKIESYLI